MVAEHCSWQLAVAAVWPEDGGPGCHEAPERPVCCGRCIHVEGTRWRIRSDSYYNASAASVDIVCTGNRAGIVIEDDSCAALDDSLRQSLAAHLGHSETVFVSQCEAGVQLRYFTPTDEVELCGHATIASMGWLRDRAASGCPRALAVLPRKRWTGCVVTTKAGNVEVLWEAGGERVVMTQARPFIDRAQVCTQDVARVLNVNERSVGRCRIVSTGLRDVVVEWLGDAASLASLCPDFPAIALLSQQLDVVGLHVYCEDRSLGTDVYARNFAPAFGIDEEPATGTSNCALICLLNWYNQNTEQGLLWTPVLYGKKTVRQAEAGHGRCVELLVAQGDFMCPPCPSRIRCSIRQDGSPTVAGEWTGVMDGEIDLALLQ